MGYDIPLYAIASLDAPGVFEGKHAKACGYRSKPLGKVTGRPKIVVVGAGFSGLFSARALAMAGFDVVLIEAEKAPGGRGRSMDIADGIPTHPGPMRQGDGSYAVKKTIEHFGYTLDITFENPNVVRTATKFRGHVYDPEDRNSVPEETAKGLKGYEAIESQPFTVDGVTYPSINQMREWLKIEDDDDRLANHPQLEAFVTKFEPLSLSDFFEEVFITNNDPPGGVRWTQNTIDAFATHPGRTGNFEPLLGLGCLSLLKWSINGNETNQVHLCKIEADGSRTIGDFQHLCNRILEDAFAQGVDVRMETEVIIVDREDFTQKSGDYVVTSKGKNGKHVKERCDDIVFAVPPAAMLKIIAKGKNLYPEKIVDQIKSIHIFNCSKVEWLVRKEPFTRNKKLPRCLQLPGNIGQVYLLNCGNKHFLKAQCYTWGSYCQAIAAQGSPDAQYEFVLNHIKEHFAGSFVEEAIPHYAKVQGLGGVETINWEDVTWINGAVALLLPGQNRIGQTFLKLFVEGNLPLAVNTAMFADDGWWKYCDRNSQLATVSLIGRYDGEIFCEDVSPLIGLKRGLYNYPS